MSISWQFLLKQAKKVFAIDEDFSVGSLMKKAHEPLRSCTTVGKIIERRENAKRARKKLSPKENDSPLVPGDCYYETYVDDDGTKFYER